jgi:ribosomal protein L12E/L44/L45/RPP1/RPP2
LATSLPDQHVNILYAILSNQIDLVALLQSAAATGAAATVGAATGAAGVAAAEAARQKDRKREPNN